MDCNELPESEIEALWTQEAERRLDELERDQITEIHAEEVLEKIRRGIDRAESEGAVSEEEIER